VGCWKMTEKNENFKLLELSNSWIGIVVS